MATTTNLATLLRNIFQKFAGQASSGPPNMVACWRATLDGPNGPEFLEELALIQVAIARLTEQVAKSTILDEQSRAVANQAIAGFSHCVHPEIFHTPVKQHQEHFSPDRLGMLGLLSSSLQIEFPEASLTKDEAADLTKEIDALVVAIGEASGISKDLQNVLLRHARFMAWAIRNIDLVGAEGVYDAIGRTIMAASRLPLERDPENDDKKSKSKLCENVLRVCGRVGQVLGAIDKLDRGLQVLKDLRDQFPGMLS